MKFERAQRPTKLFVPGFASGTHSYDDHFVGFRYVEVL
jgi:hypothetical protein